MDDADAFHLLRSIPGVGKILALVLLYEIHDIGRFAEVGNFLSATPGWCVAPRVGAARRGRRRQKDRQRPSEVGLRGGGVSLFASERDCQEMGATPGEETRQRQGLGVLAAKLGRAVYHVLRKKVAFDEKRFWAS